MTSDLSLKFGLRSLFLLTLALGITFAAIFVAPAPIALGLITIVTLGLPSCLIIYVVYGTESQRTFSIGALFPTLLVALSVSTFFANPPGNRYSYRSWWEDLSDFSANFASTYRPFAGAAWGLAILFGLMSIGIRKHIEAGKHQDESREDGETSEFR